MAGNHRSGRIGKTNDEHRMSGTLRRDRHGHRDDDATGAPVRPDGFDEDETWCWNFVVSDLVARGVAKQVDSVLLTQMCQMYSLYKKTLAMAKVDCIDKEIRCAVVAYQRAFDSIAARFGLTASDRRRLHGPTESKKKGIAKRQPSVRVVG